MADMHSFLSNLADVGSWSPLTPTTCDWPGCHDTPRWQGYWNGFWGRGGGRNVQLCDNHYRMANPGR